MKFVYELEKIDEYNLGLIYLELLNEEKEKKESRVEPI